MKYAWIEDHRDEFSVTRMCARLEFSRSGYNQWRGRKPSDQARSNEQLDAAVVKLHAASKSAYQIKSKSVVKAIFGNGLMIEGWAVYSEKVMLDAGYGGNAPEMWLCTSMSA